MTRRAGSSDGLGEREAWRQRAGSRRAGCADAVAAPQSHRQTRAARVMVRSVEEFAPAPAGPAGQSRDEHVFERRRHFTRRSRPDAGVASARVTRSGRPAASAAREPHVHPLAKRLHVLDARQRGCDGGCAILVGRDDLDDAPGKRGAKVVRRVEREKTSLVEKGHARASLRLVQVRRADEDRDAHLQELREQLPELAPRYRIHARGRLIEHDHPWLVDERAGERQLLLHASPRDGRRGANGRP